MKVILDNFTDQIIAIYQDDSIEDTRGYQISLPDIKSFKNIKQSLWGQLKDENGNLLFEETSLKPLMGYTIHKDTKISLHTHPTFWTLEEILRLKYSTILKNLQDYDTVYYEEFTDEIPPHSDSGLNFGKKICFGQGILHHSFEVDNNKIYFNCEFSKELPKIDISIDGKTFTRVKELPFSQDFRKSQFSDIFIKLNDFENPLTAYHVCFNGSGKNKTNVDDKGRGIEIKS